MRMILNPQETAQLGSTVEAELSKQAAKWKSQNVRYEWRKEKDDANTVYVITTEGRGWKLLNEMVFNSKASIQSTDKGVRVSYRESGLIGARATTLRLTGGKIISSNADEVKGNTAIWYNVKYGDQVDVVLTEASKSPIPIPCPGGLAILALLLPFGFYVSQHRS
ncbi:MAG: hypothetical protein N2559_15785 [Anaerolineae bacterium]|nr:hypothetical protein [Anaerolineae bacterium]